MKENAPTTDQSNEGAQQATRANYNTRPSLRSAINRKCRECIYDQRGAGTWRMQVSACTSIKCPLYPVRPMPTDDAAEAVNALEISEKGHYAPVLNSSEVTP